MYRFCFSNSFPIYSGWWYTYPSEKYEFVSWDYCSQHMESLKSHLPNHQPDIVCVINVSVSGLIYHYTYQPSC